ncbi:MAG: hypothetical protein ACPGTU_00670 [Myxococcota bacterium]
MEIRWRTLICCSGLCLGLLLPQEISAADPSTAAGADTSVESNVDDQAAPSTSGEKAEQKKHPRPIDPMARRVREITERTQQTTTGELARAHESNGRHRQRQSEFRTLSEKLTVALSLPRSSLEREAQIDQTYKALRGLVQRLRKDRNHAISTLHEVQTSRDQALSSLSLEGNGAAPSLEQAVLDFQAAHDARVDAVLSEIEADSVLLLETIKWRKKAIEHASADAINESQEQRLEEIQEEILSIPIDIKWATKRLIKTWWKNPTELRQAQALGSLLFGLMQLGLLLIFGIWTHGHLPMWTKRTLRSFHPKGQHSATRWDSSQQLPTWIISGDIIALGQPLGRLLQDLLIFAIALFVMIWLENDVPWMAWISLVFLCGALIRIVQGMVEIAVITPSDSRPALKVTSENIRNGLLWTIRTFGMLFAVHVACSVLIETLLGAPNVAGLISDLIALSGWGFVTFGLHRWGNTLRLRISDGKASGPVSRWIEQSGNGTLLGIVGAAGACILLLIRWIMAIGHQLIEGKAGLSWIGAFLARRQIRDDGQTKHPSLPTDIKTSIIQGAIQSLALIEEVQQIVQGYTDWTADRRRGLMVITGDRGFGKRVVLERVSHQVNEPGGVIKATAPNDVIDEQGALRWLGQVIGVPNTDSVEDMVSALQEKPSTVFLISHLHRLFLRSVGRYTPLDSVLAVMQATGNTHFWVATMHGPSWTFLHGLAEVGNVAVFKTRVHLPNLGPSDLQAWLAEHTQRSGHAVNFNTLLPKGTREGPDKQRRLERATSAYWRLLAESSNGNPSVAVRLWIESLLPNEQENTVGIRLFEAHETEDIAHLADNHLFALTALVLHDEMTVEELHAALNLSESAVRALCRHLEQKGLISENAARRYRVRLNWLPAVERLLRRRSFLHRD